MVTVILRTAWILICVLVLVSCAGLHANPDAPMELSLQGKRIAVFPFPDPYYRGRPIQGVGEPFATVFVNKLQAAGVKADLTRSKDFASAGTIDIDKACKYASESGYDMLALGTVTEWIDGATQWSGTVDVAALSVRVYNTATCKLVGSASGRQNGRWFTFVNAPTTRFYEPLSEMVVSALLK